MTRRLTSIPGNRIRPIPRATRFPILTKTAACFITYIGMDVIMGYSRKDVCVSVFGLFLVLGLFCSTALAQQAIPVMALADGNAAGTISIGMAVTNNGPAARGRCGNHSSRLGSSSRWRWWSRKEEDDRVPLTFLFSQQRQTSTLACSRPLLSYINSSSLIRFQILTGHPLAGAVAFVASLLILLLSIWYTLTGTQHDKGDFFRPRWNARARAIW